MTRKLKLKYADLKFELHSFHRLGVPGCVKIEVIGDVKEIVINHPITNYLGEYVAIHQGELVDHDPDLVMLIQRRERHYPDEVVLIRQVLEEPEQELVIK